jgi:hypothetical protein
MKIVGFAQHRNELSKGNLYNWLKCMESVCEQIYVYDQASDDGSIEILRNHPKVTLIESPVNDFSNESSCKRELLQKLLLDHPDTDWVFWMDCDTLLGDDLLKNGGAELVNVLVQANNSGEELLSLGHYNLWRSDRYYRVDSQYHWLYGNGVCALWKNNGKLHFPNEKGLHGKTYPDGLKPPHRINHSLIHRGFATDYQITTKYHLYKSHGQKGFDLERLVDERTLKVEPLPSGLLPSWYEKDADGSDPRLKEKITNIYKGTL